MLAQAEARPFLKWAGGKTQLLPLLRERLPGTIAHYFEPFVGGGALFFALRGSVFERHLTGASLNDLNASLVATYTTVRDIPERLIGTLSDMERVYLSLSPQQREDLYYEVRSCAFRGRPLARRVERAARLMFLNKTCYNGLYRENRRGEFNVPHGRYPAPVICDPGVITAASVSLQGTRVLRGDFEAASASAREGDFVYFDPPFHPLTRTSNFTSYTMRDFGRADQIRLRALADRLTSLGVNVMVSNSAHPWIQRLWRDEKYSIDYLPARRAINSRGDARGAIDELLITNYSTG